MISSARTFPAGPERVLKRIRSPGFHAGIQRTRFSFHSLLLLESMWILEAREAAFAGRHRFEALIIRRLNASWIKEKRSPRVRREFERIAQKLDNARHMNWTSFYSLLFNQILQLDPLCLAMLAQKWLVNQTENIPFLSENGFQPVPRIDDNF